MALNTFEYAALLQTKLDQKAVAEMTSGWMDGNTGDVIYKGGNKVKIPTLSTSGLKDYDRDNGYPEGSVNLTYEEMTMEMDRSTSFLIDAMGESEQTGADQGEQTVAGDLYMYVMRKMNREKKAATDAARAALLADGYRDVTPAVLRENVSSGKGDPAVQEPAEKEKVSAGKKPVKKEKEADTKQNKPAGQEAAEKESSRMPEAAETTESMQKETIVAAVQETKQPAEAASPAQEQPAEQAGSMQQLPEAPQNPK